MVFQPVLTVLTIPGGTLPPLAEILAAATRELDASASLVKRDLEATTSTWDHEVEFRIERPSDTIRIISTDDEIWHFVDGGTEPHIIAPKNAKALRFGTPYSPKSTVGSTVARAGGAGGNVVFTRKPVRHPGTEARNFTGKIAAEWRQRFPRRMNAALAAVMKRRQR